MNFLSNNPPIFLGFLLFVSIIVLLLDSFLNNASILGYKQHLIFTITIASLSILLVWISQIYPSKKTFFFNGHFLWDPLSAFLTMFIVLLTILVFLYAYVELTQSPTIMSDYYLLGLLSTFGMLVLVSAGSLLTVYLGLEIMTLPLYPMICLKREQTLSAEGAMKYIVINIFGSILLLYGLSILYNFNHSFFLSDFSRIAVGQNVSSLLHIGILLVFIAFGLKLGVVPFHFWMPDVYQSAPLSVVSFLSSAPKLAVLGMGLRLIQYHFAIWKPLLIILGLLSIIVGNFMALTQTNIKRLLAYSSIGHMGFILLSLFLAQNGYSQALFYSVNHNLMIIAMCGILALLTRTGRSIEWLDDLKGLHITHSQFAFGMLIVLVSMLGLPPFVGFFAKLGILQLLVTHHLYSIACTVALVNVISSYYYFNLIRLVYFEKAETTPGISLGKFDSVLMFVLGLNILMLLLLGLLPDTFLQYCESAIALSLSH